MKTDCNISHQPEVSGSLVFRFAQWGGLGVSIGGRASLAAGSLTPVSAPPPTPPTGARLLGASGGSDRLPRGGVICLSGQDSGDGSWKMRTTSTLICLDCGDFPPARPSRKHFQYSLEMPRGDMMVHFLSLGWAHS